MDTFQFDTMPATTSGLQVHDALLTEDCELSLWSSDRHEKLPAMKQALDHLIESSKGLLLATSPEQGPDVTAYLEALTKAPELIARESDPLLFLNCEDGDCVAASRRFAYYWDYRRRHFGPERTFLPLKVGGAIQEEELQFLLQGAFVRLPNDSAGRSVFCFNPTRRPQGGLASPDVLAMRARSSFYVFSLAFNNPVSQTDGIILLIALGNKASLVVPNRKLAGELLKYAFPVKVSHRYFAGCFSPGMNNLFSKQIVPAAHQEYGDCFQATSHIAETPQELFQKLSAHGFQRQSLPEIVGGTWDYQNWTQFLLTELATHSPTDFNIPTPRPLKRKQRRRALEICHPMEAPLVHTVANKKRKTVDHRYHDYSRVPPLQSTPSPLTRNDSGSCGFAEKVHSMLSQDELKEYIWWLPHGRAFRVCDLHVLEQSGILNQYLGISRAAIFILLLRSHGFKDLVAGKDRGSFYHECMLRGLPSLTRFISAPRDARFLLPDPANEPPLDFISMQYPLKDSLDVSAKKKRKQRRRACAVTVPIQARVVHAVPYKDRSTVDHTYRDYSQVPPPADCTRWVSNDFDTMSFVEKLHYMLSGIEFERFIWWQPHGRAFGFCGYQILEESKILLRYFGIDRAAIFILQLHNHGFKQITHGMDRGCFYHECMLRGLPHLVRFMPARRDARLLPDVDNEPPLESITKQYPLPA